MTLYEALLHLTLGVQLQSMTFGLQFMKSAESRLEDHSCFSSWALALSRASGSLLASRPPA